MYLLRFSMRNIYSCAVLRDVANMKFHKMKSTYASKESVWHSFRNDVEERKKLYQDFQKYASLMTAVNNNAPKEEHEDIEVFKSRVETLVKGAPLVKFPYFTLPEIYSCVSSLYGSEDSSVVQSVKLNMIWCLRKMPLSDLFYFWRLQVKFNVQEEIVKLTSDIIQERIHKENTFEMIYFVYLNHDLFNTPVLDNNDIKAIKLSQSLSFKEVCKLFDAIAYLKRRNLTLLRSLVVNVCQQKELLPMNKYCHFIHNLKVMSFANTLVLKKLSDDICSLLPNHSNPKEIRSLLIAIAYMKWRNVNLLDNISNWIRKHHNLCDTEDLIAYVIAIANVNYKPDDDLLDLIVPSISQIDNDSVWLTYVWSLVILDKHKDFHIHSITNSNFIVPKQNDFAIVTMKDKFDLINFIGSNNSNNIDEYIDRSNQSLHYSFNSKRSLQSDILTMLSYRAPVPTFLIPHIKTSIGFQIHGEILLNEEGNLVPFKNYDGTKQIFRVALIIMEYTDFTVDETTILGYHEFVINLLRKHGYKVLMIPYYEFRSIKNTVMKLKYLEKKIQECVK